MVTLERKDLFGEKSRILWLADMFFFSSTSYYRLYTGKYVEVWDCRFQALPIRSVVPKLAITSFVL
jgi:hypothetical protein